MPTAVAVSAQDKPSLRRLSRELGQEKYRKRDAIGIANENVRLTREAIAEEMQPLPTRSLPASLSPTLRRRRRVRAN